MTALYARVAEGQTDTRTIVGDDMIGMIKVNYKCYNCKKPIRHDLLIDIQDYGGGAITVHSSMNSALPPGWREDHSIYTEEGQPAQLCPLCYNQNQTGYTYDQK